MAKKDPQSSPVPILYEDEHILAVDKPAGIACVPAPNLPEDKTLQGILRRWAMALATPFKPYLLHRIDRDTSGIVLLGKFPRDRTALEGIFKNSHTRKIYLALVKGCPRPQKGTIRLLLEARSRGIKIPAITRYRVVEREEECSLVEAEIETGRHHQIRQHFKMIGHPLALDPLYGDHKFGKKFIQKYRLRRMFLHAWKIEFDHPFLNRKITLEAPMERTAFGKK